MARREQRERLPSWDSPSTARFQAGLEEGVRNVRGGIQHVAEDMHRILGHHDDRAALIAKKVAQKDDFHKKRRRCITNPDRALETLGPYAKLEITIHAGKNLMPRDSWTGAMSTDPCAGVLLDDTKLEGPEFSTLVVRNTTNPLWQQKIVVDVVCPMSMLRVQVYDDLVSKKDEIGFVEFCVGDIPYNKTISGWFELRYQDNLKNDSLKRYSSHCAMREDELGIAQHGQVEASAKGLKQAMSNVNMKVTVADLQARRQVGVRALAKTRTLIHGCANTCGVGGSTSASASEHERGNAGEVYLDLHLVKVVNDFDSMFALALQQPTPRNFGAYEIHEAAPDRKSLDLQNCMDTYTDVRIRLFEDFLCCLFYYFRYIAIWRQPILSAPIFLLFLIAGLHTYYMAIVVPGLCAFLLFLNGWDGLRNKMSRGGLNAMFNDDGLRTVASWKKSSEMVRYIKRIVENDLNGSVADQAKLRNFAQQVFRDGVPTITFEELREVLKQNSEMVTFDGKADGDFNKDDKVLVDERRLATVLAVHGKDVIVTYEDMPHSPGASARDKGEKLGADPTQAQADDRRKDQPQSKDRHQIFKGEKVAASRVRPRATVSFYQTWLLPTALSNIIVDTMDQIDKIENSALYPTVEILTEIVTWRRRKLVTFTITLFLVLLCCFLLHAELTTWIDYFEYHSEILRSAREVYGKCEFVTRTGLKPKLDEAFSQCQNHHGRNDLDECFSMWIITIMRNLDNAIYYVVIFAAFVLPARWFVGVSSVARIIGGSFKMRRAPRFWSFVREDEVLKAQLAKIAESSGGDSYRTKFGEFKQSMPDLNRLKNQIAGVKGGLANFKLPDLTHPSNRSPAE